MSYDVAVNALTHAATVRSAGARVVVFPELSLTGYELDAPAIAVEDPRLAPIVEACAEAGSLALVGAPVDGDAGRPHIAMLAIDGTGATVAYRKMWLGTAESDRFAPGDNPAVLDVDGWRLGLAICKDTGISQHASDTAALGIDAYVAGILESAEDAAVLDQRARRVATGHQVWVAMASFAGSTGGGFSQAAGRSAIWTSDGVVIAQAGPEPGAVARATLGGATSDTLTAEKLEVARRFWEAFSGEPITLERLQAGWADWLLNEFFAPDAVFDMSALDDWPESPLYEGHDGIRRFWEAWFGTWEEATWELERLEAVGELILSVALQRGIGASSRTPVEWRTCYLVTIRGSKIVRSRFFADPDDAIRAAGGGG